MPCNAEWSVTLEAEEVTEDELVNLLGAVGELDELIEVTRDYAAQRTYLVGHGVALPPALIGLLAPLAHHVVLSDAAPARHPAP